MQPENAAIQGVKKSLLEKKTEEKHAARQFHEKSEHEYDYARDFAQASSLALEFVKTLVPVHADLPVSYWLSPREILELNAADPTDKAIFLCSLLQALECRSARVRMAELENGSTHPLALFEFEGKSFVVDASDANAKISGKENVTFESQLAAMKIAGQKIKRSLYEFNNEEYEEFE